MTRLLSIMKEIGFPFAYHHFAEGESPLHRFLCFLRLQAVISRQTGKCILKQTKFISNYTQIIRILVWKKS